MCSKPQTHQESTQKVWNAKQQLIFTLRCIADKEVAGLPRGNAMDRRLKIKYSPQVSRMKWLRYDLQNSMRVAEPRIPNLLIVYPLPLEKHSMHVNVYEFQILPPMHTTVSTILQESIYVRQYHELVGTWNCKEHPGPQKPEPVQLLRECATLAHCVFVSIPTEGKCRHKRPRFVHSSRLTSGNSSNT